MGYSAAIQTAKAILARKGKRVTLTRKHLGTFDEDTGGRSAGGNQSSTFNVVGLPAGGKSAELQLGTLVGRKLMMFYMARVSGTLDSQPGDIVPWGGKDWPLVWSATYDPDDSGSIFTQAYAEIA